MKTIRAVLRLISKRPSYSIGFIVVGVIIVLAVSAPIVARNDPVLAVPSRILDPPSTAAYFGRDSAGMDIFSRIVYGARVDMTIALIVTSLSAVIGVPLGVISGYRRTVLAEAISRVFDVLQSLPVFVLAMAMVAVRGPSTFNVILVLSVLFSPMFVRLMRSQTYALRERGFIEAAQVSGESDLGIVFRHLIPNAIGPTLAQMSVAAGFAILLTAGLSFIGAGVQPPTPEWGSMIAIGAPNLVTGEWWPAIFPSLAVGTTVFGFALVGEALEVAVNPRKG